MRGIRAGSRVLPTPRSLRVPSLRLPYRLLRGFICGPTGWASHAADAGVANVLDDHASLGMVLRSDPHGVARSRPACFAGLASLDEQTTQTYLCINKKKRETN